MQTIRYGKARLARFEGVRVITFSLEHGPLKTDWSYPILPVKRAGITSLRRR